MSEPSTPHRTPSTGKSIALGCGVLLLLFLLAGIFGPKPAPGPRVPPAGLTGPAADTSATSEPAPAPVRPTYVLKARQGDLQWRNNLGVAAEVTGRIRNVSPEALSDVWATVSFEDAKGNLITTAEAPPGLNPLPSGASATFTTAASWDSRMKSGTISVQFHTILGEPLACEWVK